MRTLTRRGLMTGTAALASAPLLPLPVGQFTPAAAGFTLADVRGAVEALKACNVPTLADGAYELIAHPATLTALFGPDWEAQRLSWQTEQGVLTVNVFRGEAGWSDPTESALASHDGRS